MPAASITWHEIMSTGTHNLDTHRSGDTWKGFPSVDITRNGAPVDLTGASIAMHVRLFPKAAETELELSTAGGEIVITDADAGEFSIPARVVTLPEGTLHYDIELTLASGEVKTWIAGTWPIVSDVTRS